MLSVPDLPVRADVPVVALAVGLTAALAGLGLAWSGALVAPTGFLAGVVVFGLGAVLVGRRRRSRALGRANAITLARLVGLAWVSGLAVDSLVGEPGVAAYAVIVAVATVSLVLDGVDGRVARRRGEVSAFGARFDMEVDAALLMVLCVAVLSQGLVGPWVLLIGVLRYLYWGASLLVARLRLPVPPRLWRRVVAVVQGVALLVCLALGSTGLGPPWWSALVAGVALLPLLWSFLTVTVWQLRQPLPPER